MKATVILRPQVSNSGVLELELSNKIILIQLVTLRARRGVLAFVPPTNRLTPVEMDVSRKQNLCFNCDEGAPHWTQV